MVVDKQEVIQILEDLVEADKEPVGLPDLKERLAKALDLPEKGAQASTSAEGDDAAAGGDEQKLPPEFSGLTREKLEAMPFNEFQNVLVKAVNEVIE